MPPATPKNSPTSNRSAGEGRRLVRTGVRRETSVRPRARPRGRRRATRAWRQAKWRARDRSTALRPIPAERPSRMRQTNCRRGRRKLGHAPLALRYPPRAEVHTAAFRDAPASRALSGGVLLSVKERNKVRRHPGEHTRVDPRTVLRALPHDAKTALKGRSAWGGHISGRRTHPGKEDGLRSSRSPQPKSE
jgi:hypothetical protein